MGWGGVGIWRSGECWDLLGYVGNVGISHPNGIWRGALGVLGFLIFYLFRFGGFNFFFVVVGISWGALGIFGIFASLGGLYMSGFFGVSGVRVTISQYPQRIIE